jgi:hypothetical protein
VRFPLQEGPGVRAGRHHRSMFQVTVVCSSCAEETEAVVEDLDAVEREVCECGYSYVVLSVAEFEPVHGEGGQLIQLRRRPAGLKRAA